MNVASRTAKKEKKFGVTQIIIIVLVLIIIGGLYLVDVISRDSYNPVVAEPVYIREQFIDVNGDGYVDLLLEGKVIFNQGTENFTTSQPLSP